MVGFKPLNLARQSFLKTFTHGYAQSLVAASQSSSASQNTSFHTLGNNVASLLNRTNQVSQAQNAIQQNPSGPSGASARPTQVDPSANENGLAAYYAAWQRHRNGEEKELHQFQFAKRIGWKAPTTIPDPLNFRAREKLQEKPLDSTPTRAIPSRSQSADAVEGIKERDAEEFESDALEASAQLPSAAAQESLEQATEERDTIASESFSSQVSEPLSSTVSQTTEGASSTDVDAFTEQLTVLAERQQYGGIPAVFEAMLVAGVRPSPSAYNALLLAAINLPRGRHQVASKVLDVYADMVRRQILPDTYTYAIIIELLAARAMDVIGMKHELSERRRRFGNGESFLLQSDATESKILAEDDSLSMAIKLFDTSAAGSTKHVFSPETYRLLLSACAETGRIGDMVRIYADMESQSITPPSAVFGPMIQAFASSGDLRSAVECYDEYKALAIAHDNGKADVVRKDHEVYAALIKAYASCGRLNGGLSFLDKVESALKDSQELLPMRDTIALQGVHPIWCAQDRHGDAFDHAVSMLTPHARNEALSAICIDAATKNKVSSARKALDILIADQPPAAITFPTIATLAMYIREGNKDAVFRLWDIVRSAQPSADLIEPTTMFSQYLVENDLFHEALAECRAMFSSIRQSTASFPSALEVSDRLEEAAEMIVFTLLKNAAVPSVTVNMQATWLMFENGHTAEPIVERLLHRFGPQEISSLSSSDVLLLARLQGSIIAKWQSVDPSHVARFAHLAEIILARGIETDGPTSSIIEQTLAQVGTSDLISRWQGRHLAASAPGLSPATVTSPVASIPNNNSAVTYDDSCDPYGSSTDFKGSTVIADILEKSHGRSSQHLHDALARFRNMRRVGRHPRYTTYAKLISAAAKENQFHSAEDIVAMAKQDVPLIPQSKVVFQGWVSILDAMVGACLTVGRRDLASRYHQELLNIGAAPSANTFGLYITTLKESTKTFDEATEAVKIFHQAKNEGVESSSFLYNALIGKLGKARRIDDCLFYFAEMRNLGIRPTSVTYGTIVNALCRVSDDKFAEELFEEMESMSNYKPRPAPYNSLMQYFLTTKRDRSKVLSYYERMKHNRIQPTMHTYKLLIDTYATLEPVEFEKAEGVIEDIRASGGRPEAVHYASLIHAKGCVLHDSEGARAVFDRVIAAGEIKPQASLYQALFESFVANHDVASTEPLLKTMTKEHGVAMTPYIANTLIHGWAMAEDFSKARKIFEELGRDKREPSTYEAMTRANLAADDHGAAMMVVGEALRRGYPSAVANKICELVGGNSTARPA